MEEENNSEHFTHHFVMSEQTKVMCLYCTSCGLSYVLVSDQYSSQYTYKPVFFQEGVADQVRSSQICK